MRWLFFKDDVNVDLRYVLELLLEEVVAEEDIDYRYKCSVFGKV